MTNEKNGTALSGRIWKWLIGLAALCLAAYLVIWYMPHYEEVSWSGTAVEYRIDDMDYMAEHETAIAGTYAYNRAGKQTFEGNFWIDGLDMDPDQRARLTSKQGEDQFYDAAGQPVSTRVYEVFQSGRSAVVRLWDEYEVDDAGRIQAAMGKGRRFICVGTLSRQDAIILMDILKH